MSPREKLIHCGWVIAVLILCIVLLATIRFGDKPDIVTFIGVATGLVSLVVGLIAIAYAFITNGSLSQSTARLDEASTTIKSSVVEIASKLNEISSKVAEVHTKVHASSQESQPSNSQPPKADQNKVDASEVVSYFLRVSSWSGLLTLYVVKEAYRKGKPFSIHQFAKAIGDFSGDYAFGYLVATVATGMITYDDGHYQRSGDILITSAIPLLTNGIDKRIEEDVSRPGISPEASGVRAAQKAAAEKFASSL